MNTGKEINLARGVNANRREPISSLELPQSELLTKQGYLFRNGILLILMQIYYH